jgi:hypothetical protein
MGCPSRTIVSAAWEATRRVVAFYLERNKVLSAYGPVGAAHRHQSLADGDARAAADREGLNGAPKAPR